MSILRAQEALFSAGPGRVEAWGRGDSEESGGILTVEQKDGKVNCSGSYKKNNFVEEDGVIYEV